MYLLEHSFVRFFQFQLKELNPHWDGDRLYDESRKIIGAQMQVITYEHWLPLIIGEEGMKQLGQYRGYNANEDPTISNVFAASAFRYLSLHFATKMSIKVHTLHSFWS